MAGFLFSLPGLQVDGYPELYLGYASCIAADIASSHGVPTTDGTVAANIEAINSQDPDVFWSVGHGDPITHTVENLETLIRTGDWPLNLELFGGRIVHLLSCDCGQELVPDLVSKGGAEAAIGYTAPFILAYGPDPGPPPCTEPTPEGDFYTFNDCDLEIQRALLNGKNVGEAVAASQDKHELEIERYETGDRSDWPIAGSCAVHLLSNKESQVLYPGGPGPVIAGFNAIKTFFMLSGMFLVGAMVYGKATKGEWALPW